MDSSEYYTQDNQLYVNPTTSRDEQLAFVDTLRGLQNDKAVEIEQQTRNLGSDVPTNQGGLTSYAADLSTNTIKPDSYFMKRYQTPQVDTQVATLKASAQASALNNVLSNMESQYQQLYNDAYKAYQKRASSSSGSGSGSSSGSSVTGGTEYESTEDAPDATGSSYVQVGASSGETVVPLLGTGDVWVEDSDKVDTGR